MKNESSSLMMETSKSSAYFMEGSHLPLMPDLIADSQLLVQPVFSVIVSCKCLGLCPAPLFIHHTLHDFQTWTGTCLRLLISADSPACISAFCGCRGSKLADEATVHTTWFNRLCACCKKEALSPRL